MSWRRLALITAVPLLAYACASKDDPAPLNPPSSDVSGNNPPPEAPSLDGGVDDGSAADQHGTCEGNPLEADGGTPAEVAKGRFLDGPQWVDDAIVYSEVDNQAIVRNAPTGGQRTVLRATGLENLPIGNTRTGDFIYTALAKTKAGGGGGAILRMLLDGGDPVTLPAGEANSPNDIVASSKGVVYFTDPGYQTDGISTGIFRMAPDGTVTTITKYDGGTGMRADGIALSHDESTLYVGYFDAKRITKYALDAEGVPSDPQNLGIELMGNPTGIAFDMGGNLWVAENDADVQSGRVEVFDRDGKKWGEIPFPESRPSGVAFGGADGRTVFITVERGNVAEGSLYAVTSRCGGR